MSEHFTSLVGKEVKINEKGPECRWGRLLDVKSDYCVLQTSGEGLFYYSSQHIKSMTVIEAGGNYDYQFKECEEAENFHGLMRNFKYEFVCINGGPDKMEGVVGECHQDFFILVCGKEVVRVPFFHVKSVCFGRKQNKGNENQKNQEQNKSTGKQGQSKKSSGNKQKNKSTGSSSSGNHNNNKKRRRRNSNWISVTKRCN